MTSERANPQAGEALLRTKFYFPAPRDDLVRRPRLLDLLEGDLLQGDRFLRKLTLIAAPAGYGKTTLASQWLVESGIPVAWLTLEPSDNDYVRFLTYFVAAIQTVAPGFGRPVQAMLGAPQRPPDEVLLTQLVNELSGYDGRLFLVLDDYHVIQSQPIHSALNFLMEHLPPPLHLVITSREDPPLPLHRLAARRQMVAIRQFELSFSESEVKAFFHAASQAELSSQQAALLTRRTEGWVTGLQLAALSMRSVEDREAFIDSFTGSNRFILDYLFEEVFESQSEDVKSFLLQTAVLNRLCADLADAVAGREDSSEILEALDHANFFILPLDQSRQWYRYHRLFGDLLRHRLGRSSFSVDRLHARASGWFAEHGYLDEAVDHALQGAHWDRAGTLIHQAGDAKLRGGELATLLSWCKRMPEERLLSNAEWSLTYAWTLILVGDLEAGERVLARAHEIAGEGEDQLLGGIAAAGAFASRAKGDFTRTIERSKVALSHLPEDDHTSRGNLSLNLGLITWHLGQLAEAEAALEDALADTRSSRNPFGHQTALIFMGRSTACRGDLTRAVRWLEHALEIGDQLPTAALAHADLAAIQFERNQLEGAWEQVARAEALAEGMGNIEFQNACHIQRALFHLGLGDLAAAREVIRSAPAYEEAEKLPPLSMARLLACRVQIALAAGDFKGARVLLARIPVSHDAHTYCRFIDLNTARIQLAVGDRASARAELQSAYQRASDGGWGYALHAVRTLQALAEDSLEQAVAHIRPALEEAEPHGFLRVFLNEGDGILRILREAAVQGILPTYVGGILAASGNGAGMAPALQELPEQLTPRELEVLRLLAAGLSNRQIAEQLVVSLGTAKSHIHHIFGKLEVSNRTQAASRARELGLV